MLFEKIKTVTQEATMDVLTSRLLQSVIIASVALPVGEIKVKRDNLNMRGGSAEDNGCEKGRGREVRVRIQWRWCRTVEVGQRERGRGRGRGRRSQTTR